MDKITILNHPLIQHKLTLARKKETTTKDFRQLVSEIAMLMTYEISRNFPVKEVEIETPICKTKSKLIHGKKVAIVPILRAGLGLVSGIQAMIPNAKIGHIGLARNEATLEAEAYYFKVPSDIKNRSVLLVDPMLATGGSAVKAVDMLKAKGAKNIIFMCLVAAPEGVEAFTKNHPDIPIFAASLDEGLNDKGYIVPGLGDAGDRIFGTL